MSKRVVAIVIAILVVALLAVAALFIVDRIQARALPEAETALASGGGLTVETEPWISFVPDDARSTGLIVYPGALVDPVAYAPVARGIAQAGFLSVIVPMPFGIAALGADKADEVMAAHPEIEHWVVGGHSLGGAMAVQYADDRPDVVDGIALWGAYPSPDDDISDTDIQTLSVYASEDGLSSPQEIEDTAIYLPPDTTFIEIEGGNHTNFGLYEMQDGDGMATIAAADQQLQTISATVALLESIDGA